MADGSLILVVEDRADDVFIILRSFEKAGLTNPVQVVRSGEEALAYLQGDGKFSKRAEFPLPGLVVLDLKLPGIDGFEVLTWIRQQDGMRGLPVVVLTVSNHIRDVTRAYQLGANSFFVKELDLHGSVNFGKLLQEYWFTWVRKPAVFRADKEAPRHE